MPEPLSIATAVLGAVAQTIQSIQKVQSYFSKYQIADLTIAATRTECSTIRVALLQIQNLLAHGKALTTSPAATNGIGESALSAFEEYEAVLGACSITFSVLNERLAELDVYGI